MKQSKAPYFNEVQEYVKTLSRTLNLRLVILYGSAVKGSFGLGSDVDILVVADDLPDNPVERLKLLYELDKTKAPLDVKGYKPDEVKRMLAKGHPLIMDALSDGIILYGEKAYVEEIRRAFKVVRRKFRRFERGWIKVG